VKGHRHGGNSGEVRDHRPKQHLSGGRLDLSLQHPFDEAPDAKEPGRRGRYQEAKKSPLRGGRPRLLERNWRASECGRDQNIKVVIEGRQLRADATRDESGAADFLGWHGAANPGEQQRDVLE